MNTNIILYAYCEPNNEPFETSLVILPGTPFYIGIGSPSRKLDHLREAKKQPTQRTNTLKIDKIKSILQYNTQPLIVTIQEGLTKVAGGNLEKMLIAEIGTLLSVRGVQKRGPLTNLHKGGGGGVGRKKPMTEETKTKLSNAMSGRTLTDGHKLNISKGVTLALNAEGMHEKLCEAQRTKIWTNEHSRAASARAKSWVRTPEIKKKISDANKGFAHTNETKEAIAKITKEAMSSPELRDQLRESSKRRWSNPAERAKIGAKNAKSFRLTHRQTGEIRVITNMKAFCREIDSDEYWVRKIYEVIRL